MKAKPYEAYDTEVLFQVGERVHIELPEVPKDQRDTTTGVIVKIDTHFFATKEHRKIFYIVRLDGKGNYIKAKDQAMGGYWQGIKATFTCMQSRLEKLKQ